MHTPPTCPPPVLDDLVVAGFLDSAIGRAAGDYAAIATVGCADGAIFYVLDLFLRRVPPSAQIAALFDLHARWNYAVFGIETNCFQELLLLPLEEERRKRQALGPARVGAVGGASRRSPPRAPWLLPVRPVPHRIAKELRIGGLEPLVTHGWLRFADHLPELFWTELQGYPNVRNDDGLDAVEGAVALLKAFQPAPAVRSVARHMAAPLDNF